MSFGMLKYKRNTLGGVIIHLLIACSSFGAVAVAYFFVYLPAATNHEQTILVPQVEGKDVSELNDVLSSINLAHEVVDSSYHENLPAHAVIKQFPPAGSKVKEGRTISISINQRVPPLVPVPELVDGSIANAEAVLRSGQLELGNITFIPGPFKIITEMRHQGKKIMASDLIPKFSKVDVLVMDGSATSLDDSLDTQF
jgi:hypothetical protein